MTLFSLIIFIAVMGLLVWAVTTLVPMPEQFRKAIYVIAIVALCFYVLAAFGLMPHDMNPRIN